MNGILKKLLLTHLKKYPEYTFQDTDEDNQVYEAVRQLFLKLNLDEENYGTKKWNPLGKLIKPGDKVVLKPNYVSEPQSDKIDYRSIITHSSVIRPIIDYCLIALQDRGELTIVDAPQYDSNFEEIKKITQIEPLLEFINSKSKIKVDLIDLRYEMVEVEAGVITKRIQLTGDPKGSTIIDLGKHSSFKSVEKYSNKIYGSDYDYKKTRTHHSNGKHEYCISNTILESDVIINIPKLKTHKKAGITVCLKNIVGINVDKNYLPHFRFGTEEEGGDEYSNSNQFKRLKSNIFHLSLNLMSKMDSEQRRILKPFGYFYSKLGKNSNLKFESGNWHGNDTIWRAILDLNKILLYSNIDGSIKKDMQRKYIAIVDGIIGGERNGPINPILNLVG